MDVMRPRTDAESLQAFSPQNSSGGASEAAAGNVPRTKIPFAKLVGVFISLGALVFGVAAYREYRALGANAPHADHGGIFDWLSAPRGVVSSSAGEPASDFGITGAGGIFSAFKRAGQAYKDFQALSAGGIGLYAEALRFAHDAPKAMLDPNGEGILPAAKRMQNIMDVLAGASGMLRPQAADPPAPFSSGEESYFELEADAQRAKSFLDALVPWMDTDETRHIAVLFENPAELRPGGGFLGSYADVALRRGKIVAVEVHDVNDADRLLDRMIVPPKPLRASVGRFRAADANWFFDFPASASKVIEFLESSRLYSDKGIAFDMGIGVSGNVLEDLLGITGSIRLEDGTVIAKGGALAALQSRVQAGQSRLRSATDGQAAGAAYPKEALKELAALISERLQSLPDDARAALFSQVKEWILKREVRFYAKQPAFQNFFEHLGLAGSSFRIPEGFMGDYLALASANVGGGKSDFYMREKVTFESQILEEGKVQNRLTIARTHAAPKSAPWWYRETNQAYLKVFAPDSAYLTYMSGGSAKKITPKADYAKGGYETDADVARIEATEEGSLPYPEVGMFREEGKRAFATWSRVPAGASRELTLAYTEHLAASPREGVRYRFVFDAQSGAQREYHFEIHAPIGFVFAETGLPMYEYDAKDPPGRVAVTLTFSKIAD